MKIGLNLGRSMGKYPSNNISFLYCKWTSVMLSFHRVKLYNPFEIMYEGRHKMYLDYTIKSYLLFARALYNLIEQLKGPYIALYSLVKGPV